MARGNFIFVHRDVFNHPIFVRDKFSRRDAWLWMIAEAAWSDVETSIKGHRIRLRRGEFSHSLRFMAERFSWSTGALQRFFTRLKTDAMVDTRTEHGQLVVTIRNYEKYQTARIKSDTAADTQTDAKPIHNRFREEEEKEKKDSQSPITQSELHNPRAPAEKGMVGDDSRKLFEFLKANEDRLWKAGGDCLNSASPGLQNLSDVFMWIGNGADFELDILPAVEAKGRQSLPRMLQRVGSWAFFSQAVADQVARRNGTLPEPSPDANRGDVVSFSSLDEIRKRNEARKSS